MTGKKQIPAFLSVEMSSGLVELATDQMTNESLRAFFPPEEYEHDA
jgi:hypothetical protein